MKQAFDNDCEELRRPLRLWLPQKKVVLASNDFEIAKDGRVRMAPLSIAFFKDGAKGEHPEIVWIRCDEALVTLDKPATSHADLATREIVKAELSGDRPGVFAVYNRGSADKKRSLDTLIIGKLVFDAKENRLTTDDVVCMTDWQQARSPAVIRGKGMEMQFAKTQPEGYLGVIERLTLRADVETRFVADAKCRFMTLWHSPLGDSNQDFVIRTDGTLVCDLVKQSATFEAAKARTDAKNDPDVVHVQRTGTVGDKLQFDQLTCDRLELLFRGDKAFDILTAKATSLSGNEVTLALDTQHLAVHGNSYVFTNAGKGSRTIVTGDPLLMMLHSDALKGRQLHVTDSDKGPIVALIGPGEMDLLNWRNQEKADFTKHIRWRDKLIIGNPSHLRLDTFKVFGAAEFIDDENQQQIRGEQIDVRVNREAAKKADK